jgi:hypothetical protein
MIGRKRPGVARNRPGGQRPACFSANTNAAIETPMSPAVSATVGQLVFSRGAGVDVAASAAPTPSERQSRQSEQGVEQLTPLI